MHIARIWGSCLALTALLMGCGADDTSTPQAASSTGSGPSVGPTYHADVAPVLHEKCEGCHAPGHIAPFSLGSYELASAMAGNIALETAAKRMPPFGMRDTEECQTRTPVKHDIRLSEEQIAMLQAWADAGAPEGDPKDAPVANEPPAMELDRVDLDLGPLAPYTASGDSDKFRCFVLDPKLAEKKFIDGMQVVPGNVAVVHHALTFRTKRANVDPAADANGQYECFGGTGDLIHAWAPGGVPVELTKGVGVPLDTDEVLVMQIHYHPAGGVAEPDATHFQVRFADEAPAYQMLVGLIGNFSDAEDGLEPGPNDNGAPEFLIPANASGHTEVMKYTVPFLGIDHAKLYSVGTHMHYVGTDMKVDMTRVAPQNGDPAEECLIQTPEWNFEWQRFYDFDISDLEALPQARPGDTFTMRCTYENTIANPFVQRALSEQGLPAPIDVRLGESTTDEMCLFVLGFLIPN